MGNFGFVIVGVIALDIFIWVWLIISDKKHLLIMIFYRGQRNLLMRKCEMQL